MTAAHILVGCLAIAALYAIIAACHFAARRHHQHVAFERLMEHARDNEIAWRKRQAAYHCNEFGEPFMSRACSSGDDPLPCGPIMRRER